MHACVDPYSREFNSCVLGMTDGNVYVWNTRTRECSVTFENAHNDGILDARLLQVSDANSVDVLSGSKDGVVKLWNADSGKVIRQYNLPVPKARRCRAIFFPRILPGQLPHFFDASIERTFFFALDHMIYHHDVETAHQYSVFGEDSAEEPGWVTCFASVSPTLLATGGSAKRVCLWDVRAPSKPVSKICDQHKEWVRCMQVQGWNHALATGCSDAVVRIFDLRKEGVVVSMYGPHAGSKQHPARVNAIQMDFDKVVRLSGQDLSDGKLKHMCILSALCR